MVSMNPGAAFEPLREANRKIDAYLMHFSRAPVCGSDREREALAELGAVLRSAGGLIGNILRGSETQAGRQEFVRYRNNLVRLHAVLKRMYGDALELKSAVLKRQRHLDLTKQWYDASLASTADGGGEAVRIPSRTNSRRSPSGSSRH
jgi:hypothetical protein